MVDDFTSKGCGLAQAPPSNFRARSAEDMRLEVCVYLAAQAFREVLEELGPAASGEIPAALDTPMRSAVETASFALSRYRDSEDEEELDTVEDALDELMQLTYDPEPAEIPLDTNHAHLAQALRGLSEKLRDLSLDMPASVYVRFREVLLDADEALENYKRPSQEPEKPQALPVGATTLQGMEKLQSAEAYLFRLTCGPDPVLSNSQELWLAVTVIREAHRGLRGELADYIGAKLHKPN